MGIEIIAIPLMLGFILLPLAWLVMVGFLGAVSPRGKRMWVFCLSVCFAAVQIFQYYNTIFHRDERKPEIWHVTKNWRDLRDERLQLRCEQAQEIIHKTVSDVESITLLQLLPAVKAGERSVAWEAAAVLAETESNLPQFMAYGVYDDKMHLLDNTDSFYRPEDFFRSKRQDVTEEEWQNQKNSHFQRVYQAVDVFEQGKYTRYTVVEPFNKGNEERELKYHQTKIEEPSRYAIDYQFIHHPEDKEFKLAGTKVLIKDLHNNEVLAESTWYAWISPKQHSAEQYGCGAALASSTPWKFVQKVLIPKKVEKPALRTVKSGL